MPHNEGQLADRMKGYEQAARTTFPRRMPLIVRVDGKAFSKLTSELKKRGQPFNAPFVEVMNEVARALCEHIQGAQLAYVQSDEISVLVHGYKKFESSPWFDNQALKIVSVSAGIASAEFTARSHRLFGDAPSGFPFRVRPAYFDSRAFVLPEHDVANYFLWRQQDATRNSVQMLARSHFSHKECDGKSCEMMKVMLSEKSVKWDDLPGGLRRGRVVVKRPEEHSINVQGEIRRIMRSGWCVEDAPTFSQDRGFFDLMLKTEDE
jgi:tRNA(His) guanylyltransferase